MKKYKSFTALGIWGDYYVIQKYSWILGWIDWYVTYDKKSFEKTIRNLVLSGKIVIEE